MSKYNRFFENMKIIHGRKDSFGDDDIKECEEFVEVFEQDFIKTQKAIADKKAKMRKLPENVVSMQNYIDLKNLYSELKEISETFEGAKMWRDFVKNKMDNPIPPVKQEKIVIPLFKDS